MSQNRIIDHPVLGHLKNNKPITFTFDGKTYEGYEGDTVASALLANGVRKLRVHEESGSTRGIYCNIGHCFECRMTIDHTPGVRACLTNITQDMVVESGKAQPTPFSQPENMPKTFADFTKEHARNKEGDTNA